MLRDPRVVPGSVIGHPIENHLESHGMRGFHQRFEVCGRAEL